MDYIYGKLNERVKLMTYRGASTETARVLLSESDNTFRVDVIQTPGKLIVRNPNREGAEDLAFDGSSDVVVDIPVERYVRSMSLKVCTQADVPLAGYQVGQYYMETVFAVAYGEQPDEVIYTDLSALNLGAGYKGSKYIAVDLQSSEISLKLNPNGTADGDSIVLASQLAEEARQRGEADDALRESISQLAQSTQQVLQEQEEINQQLEQTDQQLGQNIQQLRQTDQQLQQSIQQLEQADQQLGQNIQQLEQADQQLEQADQQLEQGIQQEAEARAEADQQLQQSIQQETTQRESADQQLLEALALETDARERVDQQLDLSIQQEAAARAEADAALQQSVQQTQSEIESTRQVAEGAQVMAGNAQVTAESAQASAQASAQLAFNDISRLNDSVSGIYDELVLARDGYADLNARLNANAQAAATALQQSLIVPNIRAEGHSHGALPVITGSYLGESRSSKLFAYPSQFISLRKRVDGGWVDVEDENFYKLFTDRMESYPGGGWNPFADATVDAWEITLNNPNQQASPKGDRYVSLNAACIRVGGAGKQNAPIMQIVGHRQNGETVALVSNCAVYGIPSSNVCYFPRILFGAYSSYEQQPSQGANCDQLVITLTKQDTTPASVLISDIRFLGEQVYVSPSNMVSHDHAYTVASNGKDITFQGTVAGVAAVSDNQFTTKRQLTEAVSAEAQARAAANQQLSADLTAQIEPLSQTVTGLEEQVVELGREVNNTVATGTKGVLAALQKQIDNINGLYSAFETILESNPAVDFPSQEARSAAPYVSVNLIRGQKIADLLPRGRTVTDERGSYLYFVPDSTEIQVHLMPQTGGWSFHSTLRTILEAADLPSSAWYNRTVILPTSYSIQIDGQYPTVGLVQLTDSILDADLSIIATTSGTPSSPRIFTVDWAVIPDLSWTIEDVMHLGFSKGMTTKVYDVGRFRRSPTRLEFYTSENLLPSNYAFETVTVAGVTVTAQPDGSLVLNGHSNTSTNAFVGSLALIGREVTNVDPKYVERGLSLPVSSSEGYYIGATTTGPAVRIYCKTPEYKSGSLTVDPSSLVWVGTYYPSFFVYISFAADAQYDNTVVRPYLVRGSAAPSIYDNLTPRVSVLDIPVDSLPAWGYHGNALHLSEEGSRLFYNQSVDNQGIPLAEPLSTDVTDLFGSSDDFRVRTSDGMNGAIRFYDADGNVTYGDIELAYQKKRS